MDLGLRDHVLLISGGASGIGQAITRAVLAEGARVVIASRVSPAVQPFLQEMDAAHLPCEFYETELADPQHCQAVVQFVQQRHGRLDGLVNNAGVNDGVGLASGSPDRFMESLRVNLLHYYALAHYALPLLQQSVGASIVNIGSKVALTGQGNTSAYAAAKGGVLGLTREWAAELLPFGIRVNCVIPAEVDTPNYADWLSNLPDPDAERKRINDRIPLGHRMTTPAEIAAMVAFLLSPTQSSHTTAQNILVDGGYTHLDRGLTS